MSTSSSPERASGLVFYSPQSDVQGVTLAKGFLDQALSPERLLGASRISSTATVIGSGVNQLMTYGIPWRLLAGLSGMTGNIFSIACGGKKTKIPWFSLEDKLWEKENEQYVYRQKSFNGDYLPDTMRDLYARIGFQDKGVIVEKGQDEELGKVIVIRVPEAAFKEYQETMLKARDTHIQALELIDGLNKKNDKVVPKNYSGDVHRFLKANRWRYGHSSSLEKEEDGKAGDTFRRRVYIKMGEGNGVTKYNMEVIEEACRIMSETYGLDISVQLKYRSKNAGGTKGKGEALETDKKLWEPGTFPDLHKQMSEGIAPNFLQNARSLYLKLEFRRSDALQMDQIFRDVRDHKDAFRLFAEPKAESYKRLNQTSFQRALDPIDNPSDFSLQTGNASRVFRILSGVAEGRAYEASSKVFNIAMSFAEGLRGHEFTVLSPQDDPGYAVPATVLGQYLVNPCKKLGHETVQFINSNPQAVLLTSLVIGLGLDTSDAVLNKDTFLLVGLGFKLFETGLTLARNPNSTGKGKT